MSAFLRLLLARVAVNTLPQAVRTIRVVAGFSLLVVGLVLIILPGPAVVVIPLALALLAGEFVWARRLLKKFDAGFRHLRRRGR